MTLAWVSGPRTRASIRVQDNRTGWVSDHRDDDLALGPAAFDVGEGLGGLVEGVRPVEDGSEDVGLDELGDLVELGTAGAHEQERVAHAAAAPLGVLWLRAVMASRSGRRSPCWRAKAGSGGPAMPMAVPPGFRTRSDLARVSPPWESRTMS